MKALVVVWAVKYFHPYLYDHACTVSTNHEALKRLLNTPHPSGKIARWGLVLQKLDLRIKYCPGKKNANADSLSGNPYASLEKGALVTALLSNQLRTGRMACSRDRELTQHY